MFCLIISSKLSLMVMGSNPAYLLKFFLLYIKIHIKQIKANDTFHGEKKSGFVDSGFVKTCNELVIGVKQKGSPIHLLIPPSILKELRQKT